MFQGAVADAIALWSLAFGDLQAQTLMGGDQPSYVRITLAGQTLLLFDSPVRHDFTFTPAISLMVTCDDEPEVDRLARILGDGGQIFMPLDAYDFSPRYTWISDRFGVSWQLMLPPTDKP